MTPTDPDDPKHRWWRRPAPSLAVLALVSLLIIGAVVGLGSRFVDTLPEVGRDETGTDTWTAPLGVQESAEGLIVGVIPDCAADPITRIVLWSPASEPYWEVSGPARPLREFLIGFPVSGFETDVEYTAPPDDELVRLVAFRRVGSPIGIRFRMIDLANGRLMGGSPLRSYTKDGWLAEAECNGRGGDGQTPEDAPADDDPGSSSDPEGDPRSGEAPTVEPGEIDDTDPGGDTDPVDEFDDPFDADGDQQVPDPDR